MNIYLFLNILGIVFILVGFWLYRIGKKLPK